MAILRRMLLPAEQPVPIVAPQRRRRTNMAQPDFYQEQAQPGIAPPSTAQVTPDFVSPPSRGDSLREGLERIRERSAPPKLDPGSRVTIPTVDPNIGATLQKYYDQLTTVEQMGQNMTAAAAARAAHRQMQEMQRIYGQNPPGFGGVTFKPPGGGGGGGYDNRQVAPRGGSAQVMAWINQAAGILRQHGIRMTPEEARWIAVLIKHESGGNPNAYNGWDINAKRGTPSIGLMQTIGPTFNAYKLPGYNNIRDPIANIIAGVRYGIRRYGSIMNIPGIRSLSRGGPYRPY